MFLCGFIHHSYLGVGAGILEHFKTRGTGLCLKLQETLRFSCHEVGRNKVLQLFMFGSKHQG